MIEVDPHDDHVPLQPSVKEGCCADALKEPCLDELSRFRSVIFDLDGTLLDTAPDVFAALTAALEKNKLPPPDPSMVRGGGSLGKMIQSAVGRSVSPEQQQRISADFRAHYDTSSYDLSCTYPGVKELLLRLRVCGLRLHIATNKRERPTLRILDRKGIRDFFCEVVCIDRDGVEWSKKEMLEHIMRVDAVTADECVFWGDSTGDIIAGREMGMWTVGVLYGYGDRRSIVAAGPTWICERVDKLFSGEEADGPTAGAKNE